MTETNEKTAHFYTECKNCAFAHIASEGTQYGCDFGRLEKFYEKGLVRNNEDGSCTITTICNTFRKEKPNTDNPKQTVLDEIRPQVDFIIVNYETILNSYIKNLIYLINEQKIQPTSVIVVSKSSNTNYNEVYELLNTKLKAKFKLIRIYETKADYNFCIDTAVKKCTGMYYTIIPISIKDIPSDFIEKIHRKLNYNLEPFMMIDSFNLDLFTMHVSLHNMLGGCKDEWIGYKVENLAKEQVSQRMVIKYEDLT